jgi:hypothetical protein
MYHVKLEICFVFKTEEQFSDFPDMKLRNITSKPNRFLLEETEQAHSLPTTMPT